MLLRLTLLLTIEVEFFLLSLTEGYMAKNNVL